MSTCAEGADFSLELSGGFVSKWGARASVANVSMTSLNAYGEDQEDETNRERAGRCRENLRELRAVDGNAAALGALLG
jgi:hypothetical protein